MDAVYQTWFSRRKGSERPILGRRGEMYELDNLRVHVGEAALNPRFLPSVSYLQVCLNALHIHRTMLVQSCLTVMKVSKPSYDFLGPEFASPRRA